MLGVDKEEAIKVSHMLNCKLGQLPLTYLGIEISDRKLHKKAGEKVLSKMNNRLDNWRNNLLSTGGRLILVNSCLSSLPMYTMGFYRLSEEIHNKMDSIRARFFWRGASDNFKYHMMKWKAVYRPKDFGSLGVLDTRMMNGCLLSKWFWKISLAKDEIWFRLLKAKYFPTGDCRESRAVRGSQFWKALQKVRHLFQMGAIHKVRDGANTFFWTDV